jgi:soluble lytic murein transglycosylase
MVQGPLAAQAGYLRARVMLNTSSNDATRAALREVVSRFPGDSAAGSSLYLLADLATDAGKDAEARSLFEQVYRSYPTHPRAASSRFHAGVIAYASGDYRDAAAKFDSLATLMPRAEDALAARYWSGRSWAASGDKAQATQRWRDVVAQQPMSYYGFASAARSGEKPWSLPSGSDAVPRVAGVDSAILRANLLGRLGMETEARFEYDALEEAAAKNPDRALATAYAFAANGQAPRGIRLAQRLADGGQRDARVYRVLFPLVDPGEIARTAQVRKLDPALVAGLVRQESSFNPRAISVANARGLMQLLPPVGAELSRSLRFPVWHQALLFDPDANLQLGTTHLASYVAQYGALPRVLAAYNAGGSRVARWSTKSGMNDPELFAERIPFVETRDYVRIVQRNAQVYRTLWGEELGLKK